MSSITEDTLGGQSWNRVDPVEHFWAQSIFSTPRPLIFSETFQEEAYIAEVKLIALASTRIQVGDIVHLDSKIWRIVGAAPYMKNPVYSYLTAKLQPKTSIPEHILPETALVPALQLGVFDPTFNEVYA